jgi:lactate permease
MPFIAAIPILVILVLMIGFRWGAARAGAAGYLAAFFIAVVFFGAGPDALAYAHAKAILLALDVLFIIWAAFLMYRVAEEASAIKTIGRLLPALTSDRGMQALLIGWVFASFLQGAGGFGVPVAVTAPLLVSLGFSPLTAVIVPSIGHGWAVTFGSMGSSFNALLSSTGMNAPSLVTESALFLGLACIVTGPVIAHTVAGWPGVRRLFLPALVIGLVMGGVQFAVAAGAGLWNLGAFAAGLAGLAVNVWVVRWMGTGKSVERSERKALFLALSAYIVLILITVFILLVPPVKNWLDQVFIQIHFPETVTSLGFVSPAGANRPIRIFTHAGMILAYTALVSYAIYQRAGMYAPGAGKCILRTTVASMMSSSLSIALMVTMAALMQQSGMTEALSQGLAGAVGRGFPLVAPWIGGIGAFMTGSNTNSNVVFAGLQKRTAEMLSFNIPAILAGQTAGAALASVAAPTKIVVGTSTAGMEGKEGEVLRALLGYTALLVMFISILTGLATLAGL